MMLRVTYGDSPVNDSIFELGLERNAANHAALSPLSFLERAEAVWPDKTAVVHGSRSFTYAEFGRRARRLAAALRARDVGPGDTVAVLAPNTPPLLEAHYGVPLVGAVLNPLNVRLDAATIAFILEHGGAKVLIADTVFAATVREALGRLPAPPLVVDIDDPERLPEETAGAHVGEVEYEAFLGDEALPWTWPADEWQAIALNYTSGTTGDPKGVVYHHRGAFLNAMGNAITMGLGRTSVYLWTLPMFHCNGWTHTWAVTAVGGTHICLRRVDPVLIFEAIERHGVTNMAGAPIVLNLMIHAPDAVKQRFPQRVDVATGGAAPPTPVIAAMEDLGFRVTHLYGLTECYGPATVSAWQDDWADMGLAERTGRMARQGVRYVTLDGVSVRDPATLDPVPADGTTLGEIMLRGNTVMKGYLKNPSATDAGFAGGWYHTGDLAVTHSDGYVEVKDRAKDIIITGGENVSSLEVEEVLYRHPAIVEAAVVARPDEHWGETVCAFVAAKDDADLDDDDVLHWCHDHLASFKVPRTVVFGPLPKTATGKIQKFVLRERARVLR